MRTYLSLLFLLLFTNIYSQKGLNEKNLDQKLEKLLSQTHAPGFSIAVVKADKIIYAKGFGYSNIEQKEKVNENTLFAIGSTTKAFTTALLGIMEEEHGLNFDDTPRKYLSNLEFYNDELNNKLTIKDLVSHRSGLPRHDFSWYLFPTESKDSLLARVKYHEPFADLRSTWHYNNFGYLIQGLITAKLTGKTWEQNIRDRFFVPLEMSRSNLSIKEMKPMKNISTGYEWKNLDTTVALDYFNIAAISPAGSINSSAKEMSAWLKIWLNQGKYKGKQVLPEAYIKKAVNPLMLVGPGISDPQFADQHLKSYGYAWFVSSYKGHYRLEHGGNIDGFTANIALVPADSLGIIVLCNQDGSMLPALARNIMSDELLDLSKTDWIAYHDNKIEQLRKQLNATKQAQNESRVLGAKPSHLLEEFTGKYTHPGYGDFLISVQNDSLFAQFPVRKYYLNPWHYDLFKPQEYKDGKVDTLSGLGVNFNFRTGELGDVESVEVKFEPNLKPLSFSRAPLQADVSMDELKTYAGDYELAGGVLKVTVDTKMELYLKIPGQPIYTLIPLSNTDFGIVGLTGYKVQFNKSGKAIEMHLIQPNGTFTAKKTTK